MIWLWKKLVCFSKRSKGVLKGAIGALGGWLVSISRHGWIRDMIKNPTTSFSRKGFYVLNYQCIEDDRKKILWMFYSHKGGSQDFSCLRETRLYGKLVAMRDSLYAHFHFR